jgi:hypothetical protein
MLGPMYDKPSYSGSAWCPVPSPMDEMPTFLSLSIPSEMEWPTYRELAPLPGPINAFQHLFG